jgi:hypothetical protein
MERREESGLPEREMIEGVVAEFRAEELQEFLEADGHPIEADPLFKEELRRKVWELLQRNIRRRFDDS